MKAVILVGGKGTRLRPITYEIPKPLIPVKKKPIINHLIEFFAKHGVKEVGLLASREHEDDFRRWKKTWLDELPTDKVSIFYEEKPRGTFGGFEYLKDWAGGDQLLVSNGDDLKDFDLGDMIKAHNEDDSHATLLLMEVPDPRKYGVPVMKGQKINEFLEKPENPPCNYINAGLYIIEPDVMNDTDFSKEYIMFEKDIFPELAKKGKLSGFKAVNGRWFDCGNLESWEKAMMEW